MDRKKPHPYIPDYPMHTHKDLT